MEHQEQSSYFSRSKGICMLWGGLLAAPVGWALNLAVAYVAVGVVCHHGSMMIIHLFTLLSLMLGAIGFYLSWRSWQISGRGWPEDESGPIARSRFLAVGGLILSAFFSLVIMTQWIPNLLLDPCAA